MQQKRSESEARLRRLAYLPTDDALLLSCYPAFRPDGRAGRGAIGGIWRKHHRIRRAERLSLPADGGVYQPLQHRSVSRCRDYVYHRRHALGPPDWATVLVIIGLVLVSSVISFIQSERSSAAAAKLSAMISNKADVLRNGVYTELNMAQIVPGDIVRLSAGDMLPGDVLFLTAKDAFVAQSALTGESNPVEKFSKPKEGADALTILQTWLYGQQHGQRQRNGGGRGDRGRDIFWLHGQGAFGRPGQKQLEQGVVR